MKKHEEYYDNIDTEERVQIAQAICENEEDIEEAIERAKRELGDSSVPYGFEKLDEQIITTVYKMPENEIVLQTCDNNYKYNKYEMNPSSNQKYNYYSEYKKKSNSYSNQEEDLGTIYNYKNLTKNHGYYNCNNNDNINYYDKNEKYRNYKDIKDGKIENYVENKVSQDGEYLVSMTLSKKIADRGEPSVGRGKYRNNYYKEEIEVDENDGEDIKYDGKKSNKITKTHAQSIQFPSSEYI